MIAPFSVLFEGCRGSTTVARLQTLALSRCQIQAAIYLLPEVYSFSCVTFLPLVCATNYRAVPQNKLLLQRVLLVFVPGIDRDLFEASARLLPNMHRLLGEPTTVTAKSPTVSPGTMASRLLSAADGFRGPLHVIAGQS